MLLARRKEKLEGVAEEVRALGVRALPVQCDVTSREQQQAAVDAAMAEFGKIDILINNAGTCDVMPTVDLTEESWHFVTDVNLEAVVFMTKYVAKHMIEAGYGRIINIGSMYGLIPMKRMGHAEEMDGLVTLLASDGASYLTGQTIAIDGGKCAI